MGNIFKEIDYYVCLGEEDSNCSKFKSSEHLPVFNDFCPECHGKTKPIMKTNWAIVVAALISLAGLSAIMYFIWVSFLKSTPTLEPPKPGNGSEKLNEENAEQTSLQTPKKIKTIDTSTKIKSLDFVLNKEAGKESIVTAGEDGNIYFWEIETATVIKELKDHKKPIIAISVSSDGNKLISADEDTLKVWDLVQNTPRDLIETPQGSITSVAISSDGKYAISGGASKIIDFWDLEVNKKSENIYITKVRDGGEKVDEGVASLAISKNGKVIASGNSYGSIYTWKKSTWESNEKRQKRKIEPNKGEMWTVSDITISDDGDTIISSNCSSKIRVLDSNTKELEPIETKTEEICKAAISRDGKLVAGLDSENNLKFWDLDTKEEIKNFVIPLSEKLSRPEITRNIAFNGDGSTIAVSIGSIVEVWQLPSYSK